MCKKKMSVLFLAILFLFPIQGCAGNNDIPESTQGTTSSLTEIIESTTYVTEEIETTEAATTKETTIQNTTEKTANDIELDELNKLGSYYLLMVVSPQAGRYVNTRNKYEVTEFPLYRSYSVARYFAEEEKDYEFVEESIQIANNGWSMNTKGEWISGINTTSTAYDLVIEALYTSLRYGTIELVDEPVLSDMNTKHYSFIYRTSNTEEYGEAWILNEDGLPHVPVSYSGTHSALNDKGKSIMDYRYTVSRFDVSNINSAPKLIPPQ